MESKLAHLNAITEAINAIIMDPSPTPQMMNDAIFMRRQRDEDVLAW